jgi:hypothetical protein
MIKTLGFPTRQDAGMSGFPCCVWKSYPAIIHLSVWMNGEAAATRSTILPGNPAFDSVLRIEHVERGGLLYF